MAITKTRIFSSQNKAIFKITGTLASESTTIALATDLIHNGQTVGTPKVNIASLKWTCSMVGSALITRNAVVTHKLWGTSGEDFHAPTSEQNGSDIVVSFDASTAGGTVIIELSKVDGYGAINPDGLPY